MLTTVSSTSLRLGRLILQYHHLRIQTMDSSVSLTGCHVVGLEVAKLESGSSLMGQWFQEEVVQHFIETEGTMMMEQST